MKDKGDILETGKKSEYFTLILLEIFFEIATISLAFSISFVRSLKATVILSSVARCCSSMDLSMPTMPDLILDEVGATDGLPELAELVGLIGDGTGVDCSQSLAATASLNALEKAGSIPSLKESLMKWKGLTTAGPGLFPGRSIGIILVTFLSE